MQLPNVAYGTITAMFSPCRAIMASSASSEAAQSRSSMSQNKGVSPAQSAAMAAAAKVKEGIRAYRRVDRSGCRARPASARSTTARIAIIRPMVALHTVTQPPPSANRSS